MTKLIALSLLTFLSTSSLEAKETNLDKVEIEQTEERRDVRELLGIKLRNSSIGGACEKSSSR